MIVSPYNGHDLVGRHACFCGFGYLPLPYGRVSDGTIATRTFTADETLEERSCDSDIGNEFRNNQEQTLTTSGASVFLCLRAIQHYNYRQPARAAYCSVQD